MSIPAFGFPRYNLEFFTSSQKLLDDAVARGLSVAKLEAFLVNFYAEQSKIINPELAQDVSISSLEGKIMRPRQDLYLFIISNWLRYIFIPALSPKVSGCLCVFGVGRIFSAYSNMGVQYCTDADLNFVVGDDLSAAALTRLKQEVRKMQQYIGELFNILVEVDSTFTVLRVSEIKARFTDPDPVTRLCSTLFYKVNADSLCVLHHNEALLQEVFARVRQLPDSMFFENFLGDNPAKSTYLRLRDEIVPLDIVDDISKKVVYAEFVIGTRKFARSCRYLYSVHPELYPPQWCFSMKYCVNRVYDYISAMQHSGYRLSQLGFSGPSDPDYHFVCQAHRLMLYFQELIHLQLDSFSGLSDYSYISMERFTDFMRLPKSSFVKDFDGIVLSRNFLYASQRNQYRNLKSAIHAKKDLHLYLSSEQEHELANLFGFKFHHFDKGSGKSALTLPYSWGGLGFFVFNAVETRLSQIIDTKLYPALGQHCRGACANARAGAQT